MKYINEFRDQRIAKKLTGRLAAEAGRLGSPARTVTLMEVCGTHTMSIYRHGIKALVPDTVRLVSGPGCPVCVTPVGYVDTAIELCRMEGAITANFGDMIRVPGTKSSLLNERGRGRDIRVVYSPLDAVTMAKENPKSQMIFLGVGFETTTPLIASAILTAAREGVENFSVLAAHKVMPEPMEALMSGELKIDGYICPAHVSAIIGEKGYIRLVEKYHIPCVITGFEPLDILRGITMLVTQIADGRAQVENEYCRVVKPEGNVKAREILYEVFEKSDAVWRGVGLIKDSGLAIREKYGKYDAARRFGVSAPESKENPACLCGEILKGLK